MNKAVFVATSHARSGKTSVSLGLMNILVGMARKVGYFRPVISDPVNGARDEHIETMLSYFNLDQEYEEAFVFSRSQIERLTNQGKQDVVISRIIAQYKALEERYDYILVDTPPVGSLIEGAIIAQYCDGAILVIRSGAVSYKRVQRVKQQVEKSGCRILGAVLNMVNVSKSSYYNSYYYGDY